MKRFTFLAILCSLFAATSFAQNTNILRGNVVDGNKAAVPGATVTVTGDQLQGNKTATTDGEGNFTILGLAPGTYVVEVNKGGFKPVKQEGILLRAEQTLNVPISLEPGEVSGSVEVKAGEDAPIVDTSTPQKNFSVSGNFITELPLNSRQSWEAVWTMVPGVGAFPEGQNYDPPVNGTQTLNTGTPTASVVNVVQNSYTLNGMNIGNAFTNQGWRTQFSTEAIQDVSIKTAGADASTPLSSGGAINVVTKSGGNDFHGSAGIFMQPKQFNWTNIPGGTSSTLTLYQPDFSFGGPVVLPWFGEGTPYIWKGKDKLWFFMTYRNVMTDQGISRSAAQLATFTQFGLTAPTFDQLERSRRLTTKLSYQATNKHLFVFNYLDDFGRNINTNSQYNYAIEASQDQVAGGKTYQIVWTGNLAANFLWTAQYGKRNSDESIYSKGGDEPGHILYAGTRFVSGNIEGDTSAFPVLLYYGNRAGNALSTVNKRPTEDFSTDITWVPIGSHTVKAGFAYRPGNKIIGSSSGPRRTSVSEVLQSNGTRFPFQWFEWDETSFPESSRATSQRGFFAQDAWQITPRLTVTFGSRFDNQIATDIFGTAMVDTWSINPRVGIAYSLTENSRDVIRASWGRYNDLLTLNASPTLGGTLGSPGWKRYYDNNLDGVITVPPDFITVTAPVPAQTVAPPQTSTFSRDVIDPNLHTSYKDEFQISYTRQLPWRMQAEATYIRSDFKDLLGFINDNYIFTDGLFTGLKNTATNQVRFRTNMPNMEQQYRSFQASLIRNIGGRYSFFANFTYQKRKLLGEFVPDDPFRYFHPADWFNDDKNVKPWLSALNGDVKLPWGFKASAIATIESGNYGGYLVKLLSTTDPEYTKHVASITVVSSETGLSRSVPNPLRTQTRLLQPRSGDKLQTPTRYKLNLRLGKNFTLWKEKGHRLETALDIFNVFNEATPQFFSNSTRPDLTSFGTYSSFVGSPRGMQLKFTYRF